MNDTSVKDPAPATKPDPATIIAAQIVRIDEADKYIAALQVDIEVARNKYQLLLNEYAQQNKIVVDMQVTQLAFTQHQSAKPATPTKATP